MLLAHRPLTLSAFSSIFFLLALYSRGSSQEFTNKVITLWYRPPEMLYGAYEYGAAVDIWGLGCVFAEMYLLEPYFAGRSAMSQLKSIFQQRVLLTTKHLMN